MIAFKTVSSLRQFHEVHEGLKGVLYDLRVRWSDPYMEVTRIADPSPPESGIHLAGPPFRAVDLRTNDMSEAAGRELEEYANERYRYNHPTKKHLKVALQHGSGVNRHLHLQWRAESGRA
jgi:hypothetical protein